MPGSRRRDVQVRALDIRMRMVRDMETTLRRNAVLDGARLAAELVEDGMFQVEILLAENETLRAENEALRRERD